MIEHTPDAIEGYAETLVDTPTSALEESLEQIRSLLSNDPDQRLYDTQQMLAIAYELRRRHFRIERLASVLSRLTPSQIAAIELTTSITLRGA